MKIAVCLIVFNGNPYLEKWIQHYLNCPDIDYLCISEGATQNMVDVLDLKNASSTDDTLDVLLKYRSEAKIRITTAGETPYTEKVDQQNAYMDMVPHDTDYIWIADSDEFYHYSDIKVIKDRLINEQFTYVQFKMYHFFKNAWTIGIGGNGWGYDEPIDRIFAYYPGALFTSHRPITLLSRSGASLKTLKPLMCDDNNVMCYHYSYITRKNVLEKMKYYEKTFNRPYLKEWFYPVWDAWNSDTREDIESKYSIHPSVSGATTRKVNLIHPIDYRDL